MNKIPYASRESVLTLNQELRKTPRSFATPDDSGHVAFQMPAPDYWYWVTVQPDLGASDPTVARNAWRKFLNSEAGEKYKVNPHEGRTGRRTGVIVK